MCPGTSHISDIQVTVVRIKQPQILSFLSYLSQFALASIVQHVITTLPSTFYETIHFSLIDSYTCISYDSVTVYAVTSNAGEIALLFGVTVLVFLVQEDFSLAGSYADFLRSSNVAFLEHTLVPMDHKPSVVELSIAPSV